MAADYTRLFAMVETNVYVGPNKPDKSPPDKVLPPRPPGPGPGNNADENAVSDPKTFPIPTEDSSEPPVNAPDFKEGWLGYGVSVQKSLYVDFDLLTVIRMYPINWVHKSYPGCTAKNLNNLRDGLSLGAYKIATLTLKAVDANNTYPLYGNIHSTTMVISAIAKNDEMAAYFSDKQIQISDDLKLYTVVPGSFKIKSVRTVTTDIA